MKSRCPGLCFLTYYYHDLKICHLIFAPKRRTMNSREPDYYYIAWTLACKVIYIWGWFSLATESESCRSRKRPYDRVKIKNRSRKWSHKIDGIGIRTFPFLPIPFTTRRL